MAEVSSRFAVFALVFTLPVACGGGDSRDGKAAGAESGGAGMTPSGGGGPVMSSGGAVSGSGGAAHSTTSAGGAPSSSAGGATSTSSGGARTAPAGGTPSMSAGGATSSGGASSMSAGGATSMSTGGAPASNGTPRLFYLDIGGGRVLSAKPDGSDVQVLVRGASGLPDGVAVDVAGKHIFWTNMGAPDANDGFVDRVDMDGKGLTVPVAAGKTFTPKQLKLDAANGKLYWSDREGMRVMRANLDGTMLETLIETGSDDTARRNAANWCVGIAVDVAGKKIYWTQKGGDNAGVGSIRRAGIDVPAGQDPAHRTDIEVLFDHLPEPIDLDIDTGSRLMYWTDRGNPPKGNTVSRAPMDPPSGGASGRTDQQILVSNLAEGIGIALDVPHDAMYFTDLGGTVYFAKLDGSGQKKLLTGQGSLTGIAYAEVP